VFNVGVKHGLSWYGKKVKDQGFSRIVAMTLFGLRMKNQQQAGESSVMRNFMICSRA
jgi:hypothetical protein